MRTSSFCLHPFFCLPDVTQLSCNLFTVSMNILLVVINYYIGDPDDNVHHSRSHDWDRSWRPDQRHRNSYCRHTSLFSNRGSHQYQTAPILAKRSNRLVCTGQSPVQHQRHHIPKNSIRPWVRSRSQEPPCPIPCEYPLWHPQGWAHKTYGCFRAKKAATAHQRRRTGRP